MDDEGDPRLRGDDSGSGGDDIWQERGGYFPRPIKPGNSQSGSDSQHSLEAAGDPLLGVAVVGQAQAQHEFAHQVVHVLAVGEAVDGARLEFGVVVVLHLRGDGLYRPVVGPGEKPLVDALGGFVGEARRALGGKQVEGHVQELLERVAGDVVHHVAVKVAVLAVDYAAAPVAVVAVAPPFHAEFAVGAHQLSQAVAELVMAVGVAVLVMVFVLAVYGHAALVADLRGHGAVLVEYRLLAVGYLVEHFPLLVEPAARVVDLHVAAAVLVVGVQGFPADAAFLVVVLGDAFGLVVVEGHLAKERTVFEILVRDPVPRAALQGIAPEDRPAPVVFLVGKRLPHVVADALADAAPGVIEEVVAVELVVHEHAFAREVPHLVVHGALAFEAPLVEVHLAAHLAVRVVRLVLAHLLLVDIPAFVKQFPGLGIGARDAVFPDFGPPDGSVLLVDGHGRVLHDAVLVLAFPFQLPVVVIARRHAREQVGPVHKAAGQLAVRVVVQVFAFELAVHENAPVAQRAVFVVAKHLAVGAVFVHRYRGLEIPVLEILLAPAKAPALYPAVVIHDVAVLVIGEVSAVPEPVREHVHLVHRAVGEIRDVEAVAVAVQQPEFAGEPAVAIVAAATAAVPFLHLGERAVGIQRDHHRVGDFAMAVHAAHLQPAVLEKFLFGAFHESVAVRGRHAERPGFVIAPIGAVLSPVPYGVLVQQRTRLVIFLFDVFHRIPQKAPL